MGVLSTFPALVIMDRVGRRPLIIVGGLGMSFCLIIVAALTATFQNSWSTHAGAAWTSAVFIWIYCFNFGYSWGPVSWTVIAEVMPMSARAPGTALAASANWVSLLPPYPGPGGKWKYTEENADAQLLCIPHGPAYAREYHIWHM